MQRPQILHFRPGRHKTFILMYLVKTTLGTHPGLLLETLLDIDLPVFYAVDPELNWEPRFDRRIRVNTMRFSE